MKSEPKLHGLMAEFADHEFLVAAARAAYTDGYRRMDAYSPFPVADLPRAMGRRGTVIPLLVLAGGTIGGLGGYFMQAYSMAVDYPMNIGGRPLHSWPAFIPITFELTVLCAALTAFLSVFLLNKLPELYHPVFNVPEFARASQDRFFLCIEAADAKFDLEATRKFLTKLHSEKVTEVAA